MRRIGNGLVALAAALAASAAQAGDKPLFGPAPAWVTVAPDAPPAAAGKAAAYLPLFDQQYRIDGDATVYYVDSVTSIASPEVLNQRGTLKFPWQPQHGDLTIHRVEIIRDGAHIDTLAGDPGITVLRREEGLERSAVDGTLTAIKHVEGLRVGDQLRVAFSVASRDPVLAGNAQTAMLVLPQPLQIGFGRARLVWPAKQAVNLKSLLPGVDVTPRPISGGLNELVVPLPVAKLPELPKDVPARFKAVPIVVASTFKSWAEVAAVMAPLYAPKGTIAEGSDLAKVVDGIAARHSDPAARIAAALQTVQEDVRYQLIALGNGNYVPQSPAETWQKRFGDCKAKTLLLIAMLDRLGIAAEPVLASINDAIDPSTMPPAAMAFNHVFVRAEVKGESFWLDGTALGARAGDLRDVPRYGKVLPVRAAAATLIDLPLRANARFGTDGELTVDQSAGPHLPSPFTLRVRYAGAAAASVRVKENADSAEQLRTFGENLAKTWTDSTTVLTPRAVYDPVDATWTVTVEGVMYPGWEYGDGRYELGFKPLIKVSFDPDRSRSTWRQIPAVLNDPWTARSRLVYRLPDGGAGITLEGGEPLKINLPAVAWQRTVSQSGGEVTELIETRESGAEIAPADIGSTRTAINDAINHQARIVLKPGYPQSWEDIPRRKATPAYARTRAVFDQRIADKPDDAVRLEDRGWLLEKVFDWAGAAADYGKALGIDPSPDRYVKRAKVRAATGDHPGALRDVQAAFDIDSSHKEARELLGRELAIAGRADEGLDLIEAKPDVATDEGQELAMQRVEVLELAGRHDEALTILDAAIAKRPSVATLRNARCWFQGLRGQMLDQALTDCNRAIELASEPAAYLDSRAMVHFRAGRLGEALTDLDGALAIAPELPTSRFMKGVILGKQGKGSDAARELGIARKLYPDIDVYLGRYGIKP
ncbi:MAG: DUF3857 domain-containing protein [Novosphingobium sp.]